jgi:hypothetical protein
VPKSIGDAFRAGRMADQQRATPPV